MKNIQISNLSKSYSSGTYERSIFQAVDFTFEKNKTYALTGPSGCGKSTLLHCIAGIEAPTSGNIYYDKNDIKYFNESQRALLFRREIGIVFQFPYLIKERSAFENVLLKGQIAGLDGEEVKRRIQHIFTHLGITQKQLQPTWTLSGGEQQRVALARALVTHPDFLLLDEPTGNLDEQTSKDLIKLLHDYQKEYSFGILILTHDATIAATMDHILTISHGKLQILS